MNPRALYVLWVIGVAFWGDKLVARGLLFEGWFSLAAAITLPVFVMRLGLLVTGKTEQNFFDRLSYLAAFCALFYVFQEASKGGRLTPTSLLMWGVPSVLYGLGAASLFSVVAFAWGGLFPRREAAAPAQPVTAHRPYAVTATDDEFGFDPEAFGFGSPGTGPASGGPHGVEPFSGSNRGKSRAGGGYEGPAAPPGSKRLPHYPRPRSYSSAEAERLFQISGVRGSAADTHAAQALAACCITALGASKGREFIRQAARDGTLPKHIRQFYIHALQAGG